MASGHKLGSEPTESDVQGVQYLPLQEFPPIVGTLRGDFSDKTMHHQNEQIIFIRAILILDASLVLQRKYRFKSGLSLRSSRKSGLETMSQNCCSTGCWKSCELGSMA